MLVWWVYRMKDWQCLQRFLLQKRFCQLQSPLLILPELFKGASEGAGLGNKFLANIRESDAICQVIRVFRDGDVVHVDGDVNPQERYGNN
jgi:ribosome-binding ATPase YchF (GTP1/OBG family)